MQCIGLVAMIALFACSDGKVMAKDQQNQRHLKVRETWAYRSDSQPEGMLILRQAYNADGNEIEEIAYRDSAPATMTQWSYNGRGDVVLQTTEYFDSKETKKFRYDYQYDGARKTKVSKFADDALIEERHFGYSDKEREERIFVGGELSKVKKYNQEDLLISEGSYGGDLKVEYQYDDRNNVTARTEKRSGRPGRTIKYRNQYDEQGRLIRRQIGESTTEYEYGPQNELIKQRVIESGKVEQVLIFKQHYYE